MSTATLRRNRERTKPSTLPTLPAHVHQAAIWLDEDDGIAALLIDRATGWSGSQERFGISRGLFSF